MTAAVLSRLVATPVVELPRVGQDGVRPIYSLHEEALTAGLFTEPEQDDVQRLYRLFDLALGHGLPSFILDYVMEVCSDPFCTSSDPLESTLLDGRCVKRWCQLAVEQLRAMVSQPEGRQGSAATSQAAAADTLVLVAEALIQARGIDDADLIQARQLQQYLQVQEWAARQQLAVREGLGRFTSYQQWQTALRQRRSSSAGGICLLDGLLATLRDHGCASILYPPTDGPAALASIFLHGETTQAVFECKLELLLYYALDVGLPAPAEAFWHGFGIMPMVYGAWKARFLLDDAGSGLPSSATSLEEACRLLPGCASPAMPFEFVAGLAHLGRPKAALAAQRARGASNSSSSGQLQGLTLQEAQAALCMHLECGSVTEAFLEMRRLCASIDAGEEQARAEIAMTRTLVQWASSNKALDRLIELPLDVLQEQVLEQSLSHSGADAQLLPMYHLQRGRVADARRTNVQLGRRSGSSITESMALW